MNEVVRFPLRSQKHRSGLGEKEQSAGFAPPGGHGQRDPWLFFRGWEASVHWWLAPLQILTRERIRARAAVTICDPDGKETRGCYAAGLRNPVGLALEPVTGRGMDDRQ